MLILFLILVFPTQIKAGVMMFDSPVGCIVTPYINLGLCSGRGICVLEENGNRTIILEPNIPNSQCICDNGWTGVSDFLNMDSHDCGQNIIFIYILWSLILLTSSISIIYCCIKLYSSYVRVTEDYNVLEQERTDESNANSIKTKSLWIILYEQWCMCYHWPVVTISLLSLLELISLSIASLIRLANPLAASGVSASFTVFAIFADILFNTAEPALIFAWLHVRSKLVRFTEKDKEAALRAIQRLKQAMYICFIFTLTRVTACFLILDYPQYRVTLTVIYFTLIGITTLTSGFTSIKAGRSLETILVDGIEKLPTISRQEREAALQSIRRIITHQKQALGSAGFLSFLFGWWPFLRIHLTYLCFPLIFIGPLLSSNLTGLTPPRAVQQKKQKTNATTTHFSGAERLRSLTCNSSHEEDKKNNDSHVAGTPTITLVDEVIQLTVISPTQSPDRTPDVSNRGFLHDIEETPLQPLNLLFTPNDNNHDTNEHDDPQLTASHSNHPSDRLIFNPFNDDQSTPSPL